jgi:hypothetical protein
LSSLFISLWSSVPYSTGAVESGNENQPVSQNSPEVGSNENMNLFKALGTLHLELTSVDWVRCSVILAVWELS